MDLPTLDRLERIPMSRERFDALPDGIRAEYVAGSAVVSPQARGRHQDIAINILVALRAALPTAVVRHEAGFALPSGSLRIPDVSVQRVRDDEHWSDDVPVVAVEVLSPSTWREDVFRKSDDYRVAGIEQYWIADRQSGTLVVRANRGAAWDVLLELGEDAPVGSVQVADLGSVALDLTSVFT